MDGTNWNTEFSQIVEEHKYCLYDICKACMNRLMEDVDNAQEGFRIFLTEVEVPRYAPNEIPEEFFDVDADEIDTPTKTRLTDMEHQIVKELISQNVSEDVFYEEIWNRILDKILVSNNHQRSFLLVCMWLDPRIPYYQLGLGVSMDNDTYKKCVQQLEFPYKKMLFAMNAGYPQKTQKASILLKIADEISDQNERIVFWSLTISRLESRILKLKKRIQELESLMEADDSEIE